MSGMSSIVVAVHSRAEPVTGFAVQHTIHVLEGTLLAAVAGLAGPEVQDLGDEILQ